MLRAALRYPVSGDDGVGAVLVGGGLLLLAVLISFGSVLLLFLPLVITLAFRLVVRGYYVRVMRWTSRHPDADAPPFDDWGDLIVDGLKAALVGFVYWLPAIVLFVLAVVVAGIGGVPETGAAVEALDTVTGLFVLFGLLYLLAMFYVLPAAVTNFAYHDDLSAAFHLREVVDGVLTEDYAVGWVFTVVYQAVLAPFVLLLSLLLVGFFLRVHVAVGVRHVYGRALRDALDLEELVDEPDDGRADPGGTRTDRSWTEEFRESTDDEERDS